MRIEALAVCLLVPLASHAFAEPDPAAPPIVVPGWKCSGDFASLPDGSIFVYASGANNAPGGIFKFRPDGAPDAAWASSGGFAGGPTSSNFRLVTMGDGSLLAVGFGGGSIRLTRLGVLDKSFGTSGVSQLGGPNFEEVALQPDGSAVMQELWQRVGWGSHASANQDAFMRYKPDGTRDLSFGQSAEPAASVVATFNAVASIYAWSVMPDGSVEVGDYLSYNGNAVSANGDVSPELHRYPVDFPATGPDALNGRLMPHQGVASWTAPTVGVDPQGNAYFAVADVALTSGADVRLLRYGTDGRRDASFGGGNNPVHAFPGATNAFATTFVKALWQSASGDWNVVLGARLASTTGDILEHGTRLVRYGADGFAAPAFQQMKALDSNETSRVMRLVDGRLVHATSTATCTIEHALGDPPATGTMVEYYKPSADHYFMTLEGGESVLLDTTPAGAGWQRTGRVFGAWKPSGLAGSTRLCRFYGDLEGGPDSHFYTPEGPECDGLRAQDAATPPGQYAWRFEGYAGNVAVPVNGACAANLTAVYRLYNRGFEKGGVPNHRYTVDASLYADMQAKGWAGEGIAFCVPPAPNNLSY